MSEIKCYICNGKFFPQQISTDKGLTYCDSCGSEHRKRMQECHAPDCENKKIGAVKYCPEHWILTSQLQSQLKQKDKTIAELREALKEIYEIKTYNSGGAREERIKVIAQEALSKIKEMRNERRKEN